MHSTSACLSNMCWWVLRKHGTCNVYISIWLADNQSDLVISHVISDHDTLHQIMIHHYTIVCVGFIKHIRLGAACIVYCSGFAFSQSALSDDNNEQC